MEKMKKLIMFVVLCLCFVNVANAQTGICQYKETDIESLNGRMVLKSTKRPINGVICSYYTSGKLLNEFPHKDGKREGVRRVYYESGKLMGETPYKDDKVEGVLRVYFETGKLNIETPYKNHKREGYERIYYVTGQLRAQILYKNDEPISGACGDRGALTNAELTNWANGGSVSFLCTPQR